MISKEQPGDQRPLRLGIDYGTSRSKLVLTDYGARDGQFSFVLRPECANGGFLIPSTVCVVADQLYFGCEAEERSKNKNTIAHRSLKMRTAYPDQFYGDPTVLPPGLDARDLATIFVGHLVALGRDIATEYAAEYEADAEFSITLGAPVKHVDEKEMFRMFVSIAREAFELDCLLDLSTHISIDEAREALEIVRGEIVQNSVTQPRDWVRTEAEAALFWAYRSPATKAERYACVDVGAGTTNASWLHISDEVSEGIRVKKKLSFFAAECEPPACDALNQILSSHIQDVSASQETRGRENELALRLDSAGRTEYDRVLSAISKVFVESSKTAYTKEEKVASWAGRCQVFLHGGGSRLQLVRKALVSAKKPWLIDSDPVAEPGLPDDLKEMDGSEICEDVDFLLVAYGLARRLGDVIDVVFPVEIEKYKPEVKRSKVPHHTVQYGD